MSLVVTARRPRHVTPESAGWQYVGFEVVQPAGRT